MIRGGRNASTPLDSHTVVEDALAALDPGRRWQRSSQSPTDRAFSSKSRPPWADESNYKDLSATVDRPKDGQVRIAFRFSACSADRAAGDLNGIVAAYATRLQMRLAREVLRRVASVRTADERFDREIGAVGSELDKLVDRAVKLAAHHTAEEDPAQGMEKSRPSSFKEKSPGSSRIPTEHVSQTEALSALEELRQRRAKLLLDRTPAHPEVRQVEILIAEAEKHLEEIPAPTSEVEREMPREAPKPSVERPLTPKELPLVPASPSTNSAQWTELFQAIQSLQGRVERVYRELERTRGQQVAGSESLLRGEDLEIRWAENAQGTAALFNWPALALVGLAGGLVATAGIAMVWAGARIDPPIVRRESIERGLGLPVLGAIPVDQVLPDSVLARSARARWRWPCIVGGLAVIAGYFVFLLQPFLAG